MKIALTYQTPSPELEVIRKVLSSFGDVTDAPEWNPVTHERVYDLAVVAGPAQVCPLAHQRMMFVLGQTKHHLSADWDAVVVTSEKSRSLVRAKFGYGLRTVIAPPPLTMNHLGRKRKMSDESGLLHCSEGGLRLPSDCQVMRIWGQLPFNGPDSIFNHLEFNSSVRAGKVGYYPMEDGFDIQVRRHLSLGGAVVCRKDPEVIGPLANLCLDVIPEKCSAKMKQVDCVGSKHEYNNTITGLIRKLIQRSK